ncbi:MAG: hypothetical protein IK126_05415 [Bacteroidales bacterium]|nr:hypothetical protein [Bacteroidales bacterium]
MTKQQKQKKVSPHSPLEAAVANTPEVAGFFCRSLQALESKDKNKDLIDYENSSKIMGSVYLEKATKNLKHPFPKRWDYVIEYSNKIYYYEPHSASGGNNIEEVIGKAEWLRWWLTNNAPDIKDLGTEGFFWIHTGKCNILPNSQQSKKLLDLGVQLKSKLYMK